MLKSLYMIYFVLIFGSILFGQIAKTEAESAQLDSLSILEDETASQGKFVQMEKAGSLKWDVSVEEPGWYNLTIRYRAMGGEKEEYLINNGWKIPLGFGINETWAIFHKNIYLEKIANSLELKPSWGYLDIDYLSLDKPSLKYALTPKNNNYYLAYPRDLSIKIDNFKSAVKSVLVNNKNISFREENYPYEEKATQLILGKEQFGGLSPGSYELGITLENNVKLKQNLSILNKPKESDLKIIVPYIEHGTAVLFILPDNSSMLVDCAKEYFRDKTLIPLMRQMSIDTLDHFFITHYHGDHDGGDKGKKIKEQFHVKNFYDYKTVNSGGVFNLADVNFKILNSYSDGHDENTRSLSFKMEYNGFVYVHGGDTYGLNQVKILETFPEDIQADLFYANHHFHGSVDVNYLRAMQPSAVVLQAQEAIYARSAYWQKYLIESREYLLKSKNHFVENLPALEVGTTVFRINSQSDWTFDTYIAKEPIPFYDK